MNPVMEPAFQSGQLPRESFEPVISRPIEIENLLDTELTVNFYNLDGDHAFKTCYGDLIKTINALMDYSRILEMVCEEWHLEGFHRATYEYHANKLREIAGRFQSAVGYDYAAAVEKCRKKHEKPEREKQRESRDLVQDLQDIQNGIAIIHASDQVKLDKAAKRQRKTERREKRKQKLEEKIIKNGWESVSANSSDYFHAIKWFGEEKIQLLEKEHQDYLEAEKRKPRQMSLFDMM